MMSGKEWVKPATLEDLERLSSRPQSHESLPTEEQKITTTSVNLRFNYSIEIAMKDGLSPVNVLNRGVLTRSTSAQEVGI